MNKIDELKENLFAWYEFRENSIGILISDDDYYRNILETKLKLVSKDYEGSVDYIFYIGTDVNFNTISKNINDETIIIVINNNPLSVDRLSKYPNNLQETDNINSIDELIREFKNIGFNDNNLFYLFPNYKYIDYLYNSNYLIKENEIEKYNPFFCENDYVIFDEKDIIKKIYKNNNLMKVFANAFFIEFRKYEFNYNINYVSFNNVRKEKYRLMTILRTDVVEKCCINETSIGHINNMKNNIEILKQQDVNILDYLNDNRIYSKLIKDIPTLDTLIVANSQNLDFFKEKILDLRNILNKNAIDFNDDIKKSLKKYDINIDKISKLRFVKDAFIDMIFKNCFEINGEYYFFDQEWKFEYLPVDFIIFRAIINTFGLVKHNKISELYKIADVYDYVEEFEKINEIIMAEILDEELSNRFINMPRKSVDDLIFENNETKKVIEASRTENIHKEDYINQLHSIINSFKVENEKKEQYIKYLEEQIQNNNE